MNNFETIEGCETELTSPEELLWRQVSAHNWDPAAKMPSEMAFGAASIDEGRPSFARSSKVSAQESRDWHQHHAKSRSLGVWACSVGEVRGAGSRALDDTGCPEMPGHPRSPGHCYSDYRHLLKKEEKTARKIIRGILLAAALKRGEIPTEDCSYCLRIARSSFDDQTAMREKVDKWIDRKGMEPDEASGDPSEVHYARLDWHLKKALESSEVVGGHD